MPTYEFEDEVSGEVFETFFHMADAPAADGQVIEVDGRRCRRLISTAQARIPDYAHASHALPRRGSGIEKVWNKFTPDGKPYFEGRKDIREFESRTTFRRGDAGLMPTGGTPKGE